MRRSWRRLYRPQFSRCEASLTAGSWTKSQAHPTLLATKSSPFGQHYCKGASKTCLDAVNTFGSSLNASLNAKLLENPSNGGFIDSCNHYCGSWASDLLTMGFIDPRVDGAEVGSAFNLTNGTGEEGGLCGDKAKASRAVVAAVPPPRRTIVEHNVRTVVHRDRSLADCFPCDRNSSIAVAVLTE